MNLKDKSKKLKPFHKVLAVAVAINVIVIGAFAYIAIFQSDYTAIIDGKQADDVTYKRTVGDVIDSWGLELGEDDVVEPALDTKMEDGTTIEIKRTIIEKETVKEETKFKTVKSEDTSMGKDETKVLQKGVKGVDKVTYEITYFGGEEQSRKEVKRETIKKPVTEKIAYGTRETYNGETWSRKITVKATAYTGGGTTATGTRARVGEIAVDPRVIPLGSTCYVVGYGACRAEDTGGAVKGNYIDVYFNTLAECRQWGVRYVTIYIK